jgi:uncharacterized membrane protein
VVAWFGVYDSRFQQRLEVGSVCEPFMLSFAVASLSPTGVFKLEEEEMFGRNKGMKGVASAALDNVSPYVDQLANDEKLRQRLVAAISAGAAARQRAKTHAGMLGIARRVGSDPVLRAQVFEAVSQLRKARGRIQKKDSHTTRNFLLLLMGAGMVVAGVPKLRNRIAAKVRGVRSDSASHLLGGEPHPTSIEQQIEVDAPVGIVYSQWTQFEEFPKFMEGVDEVTKLDDTLLHWAVTVAGKTAEWDAKITAQDLDRRIAWESVDGKQTRGTVNFEPLEAGARTRIRLQMSFTAEGAAETAGAAIGLDERRVRGDLERFRDLVESQSTEARPAANKAKNSKNETAGNSTV